MTPKLGLTKLRRYAFVWRYDTTNRKPHVRKQWEKYGWTKRIHRFREIRGWTTRWPQNDFSHELAQSPRYRYYSSAEPLFESHNYMQGERRKQWNSRQRTNSLKITPSNVTSVNISWNFRFSRFCGSMEPPLVPPQILRCKFVLRFGATNRKP